MGSRRRCPAARGRLPQRELQPLRRGRGCAAESSEGKSSVALHGSVCPPSEGARTVTSRVGAVAGRDWRGPAATPRSLGRRNAVTSVSALRVPLTEPLTEPLLPAPPPRSAPGSEKLRFPCRGAEALTARAGSGRRCAGLWGADPGTVRTAGVVGASPGHAAAADDGCCHQATTIRAGPCWSPKLRAQTCVLK